MSLVYALIFLSTCTALHAVMVAGQDDLVRVKSPLDETTCVCGLSEELLDRLERILRYSKDDACLKPSSQPLISSVSSSMKDQAPRPETNRPDIDSFKDELVNHISSAKPDDSQQIHSSNNLVRPEAEFATERPYKDDEAHNQSFDIPSKGNNIGISAPISPSDLLSQLQNLQGQIAELAKVPGPATTSRPTSPIGHPVSSSNHETVSVDPLQLIQQLQQQQLSLQQHYQLQQQQLKPGTNVPASGQLSSTGEHQHVRPTGFLENVPNSVGKLNQSGQVKPEEVADAVESTVPNVVSNIFSNIQDLANQDLSDSSDSSSSQLTSIDGNSVNVAGSTVDQITAEGEKLFAQWIEHQLSALHLTVSAANNIRKNAIDLFRRIVKQYMAVVDRLGGSIEDNVRKATQMALSNTQTLTSFLLRNYLNVAGLILRLIGDQVSRIGKQLDATGGTIATMSLNPFDVISNVIDSLPNPAEYSKYFREIGKYLTGETNTETRPISDQVTSPPASAPSSTTNAQTNQQGVFSKTMGSLGKTLSSWIG